jgi:GntR family transcriptional regulator
LRKVTLSASIRDAIRARIEAREWTGRLPSEPELAGLYSASRETVRKALAELEGEGLLHRVHGRGTFVEARMAFNPLSGALSITEELARSGLAVRNEVLVADWIAADAIPADFLHGAFQDAERVFRLVRLRKVRQQPLALEISWFREEDFPGLAAADLRGSLHALMTERFGRSPDRVQNRIQALDFHRKEAREAARLLGSRAILRVERVLTRRRRAYYAVAFTLRTDLYPLEFTQVPPRPGGRP